MLLKDRPTSPHLTIYRRQISSVLSIGHRMSGIGIFTMLLFFSWWFILWSFNDFKDFYADYFHSNLIKTLLFITSYGYFYHLCMGIRHLMWDCGFGFSINAINKSGWTAIIFSILLTTVFWLAIYC